MKNVLISALALCLSAQIGLPQGNKHKMSISGTVTGASATITLSGTLSGTQATDSFGNYTFPNLVNGSYVVAPSHSGYTFSPSTVAVSISGNNSVTGVNFTATAIAPPTVAPVINYFTGSPTSILSGASSVISWSTTGATTVSINQAIGTVAAIGTTTVSPVVTTVYTLTATNSAGTVTRNGTITVNTSGPLAYWDLNDSTAGTPGTTATDSSGNSHTMTLVNGPVWQLATACATGGCLNFNGTTQYGSVALDLTGTNVITIEFWMKWNAFANDDKLAFEFSPNFNNVTTGFLIDPDESGSGQFQVGVKGDVGYNQVNFTRPSAGVWHNYAFILNKGAAATTEVIPYVDGLAISYSKPTSAENTNNFGSSTLYAMSRAGSSLFGGGLLDDLHIYNRGLTASEITALAGAGTVVQHSVNLSWTASTSAVSGYNVKRGTVSGGPYVQLNPALLPGLTYSDSTGSSGRTYYYVATDVNSSGAESGLSNQATAVIP